MNQCPKCGALVLITQGFECPECGQFTCDSCFDEATGMCTACAAGRTAANEKEYVQAQQLEREVKSAGNDEDKLTLYEEQLYAQALSLFHYAMYQHFGKPSFLDQARSIADSFTAADDTLTKSYQEKLRLLLDEAAGHSRPAPDAAYCAGSPIYCTGTSNPYIKSCRILAGGYDGITVQENSCQNVEECEIALNDCNIYGHKRAPGIMAGDNADPHITACDIHDNIEGIWTINGKGKYTDCKVHDNVRHGIHIKDTATPYISGSICNSNNWSGLSIAGGANATFHQCTVRDNGRNDGDKGNPQPGVIALEAAKLHMSSCEKKQCLVRHTADGRNIMHP